MARTASPWPEIALGLNITHARRGDLRITLVAPNAATRQVITETPPTPTTNYDVYISTNTEGAQDDNDIDPVAAPFYNRLISLATIEFLHRQLGRHLDPPGLRPGERQQRHLQSRRADPDQRRRHHHHVRLADDLRLGLRTATTTPSPTPPSAIPPSPTPPPSTTAAPAPRTP